MLETSDEAARDQTGVTDYRFHCGSDASLVTGTGRRGPTVVLRSLVIIFHHPLQLLGGRF